MPGAFPDKRLKILIITAAAYLAFLLQYLFRYEDDNRLTSWKWAMTHDAALLIAAAAVPAIIVFYFLLKSPVVRQRTGLFIFFLCFALSALFWSVPEVIVDTSRYFTYAKYLELYGVTDFLTQWGRGFHVWTDMPMVPLLHGIAFRVFGEHREVIQVINSLAFSFTALCTWKIGAALWDSETGLCGALMLLGMPYIFSQTPLMLVDVPAMFFLTFAVYAFITALEHGGLWLALSPFAILAAALSKYSVWLMLSVLGIIVLVYAMQGAEITKCTEAEILEARKRILFRTMSVCLVTIAGAGVYLAFKYDVTIGQIGFLQEYQAPGLRRWGESFVSTFLFQVHPFITIAAVISFVAACIRRDWRYSVISWLVVLVLVLQVQRSRYLLVIFPMFALMGAYGIRMIEGTRIRRWVLSCIIALSLSVALFAYRPLLKGMSMVNFADAGVYLNSSGKGRIGVVTMQSGHRAVHAVITLPVLDLFTDGSIAYLTDNTLDSPPDDVSTSPLRFTWEYSVPDYYRERSVRNKWFSAIAVISCSDTPVIKGAMADILDGYYQAKVFDRTTDLFGFSPAVAVYLPVAKGGKTSESTLYNSSGL